MNLTLKMGVMVALVLVAQTGLGLRQVRRPPLAVRELRAAARRPVVFLGDSVNHTVDPSDHDRAWISQMLGRRLVARVGAASRGGWDMEVFEAASTHIARVATSPRTVLITVNPASLWGDGRSPYTTHANLALDLRRTDSVMWAALAQPLRVFRGPAVRPGISLAEYLAQPVIYRGQVLGRRGEFEPGAPRFAATNAASLRDHVVVRYLQPLAPNNRLLRLAARAAERLTRHRHRAIFFVVPVDVERCARVAPEIEVVLSEKVAAVRKAVEPAGGEVVDMSCELGADHFIPSPYPNEHLNERGRNRVADRLAALVTNPPARRAIGAAHAATRPAR
ncbi:MAG: hypothetical protein N2652_12275 [Kiritimatiellae bacterium]|nr:hypothetical protein [Kiritimatiellia bacterium]